MREGGKSQYLLPLQGDPNLKAAQTEHGQQSEEEQSRRGFAIFCGRAVIVDPGWNGFRQPEVAPKPDSEPNCRRCKKWQ
jgi:hypothetical protein